MNEFHLSACGFCARYVPEDTLYPAKNSYMCGWCHGRYEKGQQFDSVKRKWYTPKVDTSYISEIENKYLERILEQKHTPKKQTIVVEENTRNSRVLSFLED